MDQPLAMTRAGQDYYLHADHQGSIVRVTDAAGAVVNSYEYDAYGRRLAATEGVALPYGYTGREFDPESGLMYYRARMYDPATGRFLQTDPIGFAAGDLNLYRYVFNNPVNRNDPSGEAALLLTCVTGAGLNLAAFGAGVLVGAQLGGDANGTNGLPSDGADGGCSGAAADNESPLDRFVDRGPPLSPLQFLDNAIRSLAPANTIAGRALGLFATATIGCLSALHSPVVFFGTLAGTFTGGIAAGAQI